MGRIRKTDEDTNPGTPNAKGAGPAPGKTTLTQALPAAKQPKVPEGRAFLTDRVLAAQPDDPFGLHVPHDEYLVRQDFELVKPAGTNIATASEYAQRVTAIWGSCESYVTWRHEADALLDKPLPSGGTVRRLINEAGDTQRVFFYWVAWEYVQRGLDDAAIVALFDSQIVGELRGAVASAEAKLGATIPIQGFSPRPQRDAHGYVMGTLSNHGLGRAVDIEPSKNPIINADVWARMEALVGRKVDRSRDRWMTKPDELYDDLVAFSEQWATYVKDQIAVARSAPAHAQNFGRQHPGTLVDFGGLALLDKTPHPLLDNAPVVDEKSLPTTTLMRLLHIDAKEAAKLAETPGFEILNHPRARVLALREQGLVWGATFQNVDLHHFELADRPLKPWFVDEKRRAPTRTDADFESKLEPY
jgi:hypothetical protein